ncbi:MAG: hypothetical protein CMJ19_16260 [Phycisphaeraceae bacterium]|nr:hypothetical protein [Phycisphaeraceae bacterium]
MPPGHGIGVADLSLQYEPRVHAMQPVWPLAFWYSPLLHGEHSLWPVIPVNVPGTQAVGATEPVAHAEPAGQAVHSAALARPYALDHEPAGHGLGRDVPDGQK